MRRPEGLTREGEGATVIAISDRRAHSRAQRIGLAIEGCMDGMGYVGRSEVNVFKIASQSILLLTIDYLNGLSLFIRFFLGGAEESMSGFCGP